jgi:hypothetical protein
LKKDLGDDADVFAMSSKELDKWVRTKQGTIIQDKKELKKFDEDIAKLDEKGALTADERKQRESLGFLRDRAARRIEQNTAAVTSAADYTLGFEEQAKKKEEIKKQAKADSKIERDRTRLQRLDAKGDNLTDAEKQEKEALKKDVREHDILSGTALGTNEERKAIADKMQKEEDIAYQEYLSADKSKIVELGTKYEDVQKKRSRFIGKDISVLPRDTTRKTNISGVKVDAADTEKSHVFDEFYQPAAWEDRTVGHVLTGAETVRTGASGAGSSEDTVKKTRDAGGDQKLVFTNARIEFKDAEVTANGTGTSVRNGVNRTERRQTSA